MRKRHRFIAAALGLSLLLGQPAGWLAAAQTGEASAEATPEEIQKKLDELQVQETQLKEKVNAARQDLSDQKTYKSTLDQQIGNITMQIDLLEQKSEALDTQIREKEEAISAQETSIEKKEAENNERFQKLQQRLRAISKSGNMSALQMLLSTESYTDLLIRSKLMETVAENDQRLMDELEKDIREIRSEKETLQKDKQALQVQKTEFASVQERETNKKRELEALSREAASVMQGLEEDLNVYNENLETIRREEEAMDQLIEDLLNRIPPATTTTAAPTTTTTTTTAAATTTTTSVTQPGQTTASGGTTTTTTTTAETTTTAAPTTGPGGQLPTTPGGLYDSGTMYWPVPTVKYVSDFFGGSRNHKGLDIANSPTTPIYGENIVAARDGVVIYANSTNSYGGGYGYHCIVDHGFDSRGKRIVTLYAHASAIQVTVGQTVYGGKTVLGQAGNTGNVSGPHLHFEVRENNVCVDPLGGYLIRK